MGNESTFRMLFVLLLAGLLAMRGYFGIQAARSGGHVEPTREAVEREGRGGLALRFVMFVVLIAAIVLYVVGSPWMDALSAPLPAAVRWLGAVFGLISLALWTWVQGALGRQWSPNVQLQSEHVLVTSGPYRWVRHPLYSAMFLWAIAASLITANWLFIAVSAVSIVGTVVRIPKEEAMMLERFGDDYRAYMQRTGRLLPRLGRGSQ